MENKSYEYTPGRPLRAYDEQGQFSDFSTDDLVGDKLNFYKNWMCGAGSQNLHINMDGDVYAASCKVGGKLGNVFEDFSVPEGWIRCVRDVCSCGADLFIPKAKEESMAHLLRKTNSLAVVPAQKVEKVSSIVALERTHSSNTKQVYWEIGRRCNYNCSYCWPWIHNNTEEHKTLAQLMTATRKMEEKFIGKSRVNFIISGGEPAANPALMEWARYLKGAGHHLSLHSNGSRQPDYYRELIHCGDLNLSVHFEFWNKEKFLKVVTAVTEEKVKFKNIGVGHLEVKIMMAPGRRDLTLDLEAELRKIPNFPSWCTWAIVPVRDGKMGDKVMSAYEESDFTMFGDRA